MKRLAIAFFALSCLAACGLKGDLERPPPLWGDHADQQHDDDDAEQTQQAPQ